MLPTSPVLIRRVPRPPTAAPAVGGWGSLDLLHVYSVGVHLVSSRRRWGGSGAAGVVFGGWFFSSSSTLSGVPASIHTLRRACRSAEMFGLSSPSPDAAGRRIWPEMVLVKVVYTSSRLMKTAQGGGPSGPSSVDFPSARGLLPFQGVSGGAAAARRSTSSSAMSTSWLHRTGL